MKDSIDIAFGKMQGIANEIEEYGATIKSESDTRLKVIDRILTDILGWPVADISTSERAGTGFTDYVLRACSKTNSDFLLDKECNSTPAGFVFKSLFRRLERKPLALSLQHCRPQLHSCWEHFSSPPGT